MSIRIRAGAEISLDIAAVVDHILESGASTLGEAYSVDQEIRAETKRLTRRAPIGHRHLSHRQVLLVSTDVSALAARAIAEASRSTRLRVIDSAHPADVRNLIGQLSDSVVVITSHSGDSAEAETILRIVTTAYRTLGDRVADRVVVITRPGTSLASAAERAGATQVACTAHRGGNVLAFSALTLLPCFMAGIDVDRILHAAAAAAAAALTDRADNVALLLAAALHTENTDTVGIVPVHRSWQPMCAWASMLVRLTTGKQNTGHFAYPLADDAPELATRHPGTLICRIGARNGGGGERILDGIELVGVVGEMLVVWQYAAVVAARVLGVQPASAPEPEITNARVFAISRHPDATPHEDLTASPVAHSENMHDVTDLTAQQAVSALLDTMPPRGHLVIGNYAGSGTGTALAVLRTRLAALTGHPVLLHDGTATLAAATQFDRAGGNHGAHLLLWAPAPAPFAPDTLSLTLLSHARFADDARTLALLGRPVLTLTAASGNDLARALLRSPAPTSP